MLVKIKKIKFLSFRLRFAFFGRKMTNCKPLFALTGFCKGDFYKLFSSMEFNQKVVVN